ncbi:hypothetical protein DFH08DRAFT_954953 [Mycena albidolilacea]|uniref:Uncharacterized protein n=1 Tax=Mycena albidolilacea TaxID=1033008 RepID=A0AAD7AEC4_9AGAR|nr:hypothetical protein DFH08DRAFT_954953 [Mycena albidolilacea]
MSQLSNNFRRGSQARHGTARLPSAAGYNDKPQVYSALSFELWALPSLSGRYVQRGNRLFELWSPNSKQLPGERSKDGTPGIHPDPSQRRFNGHAGKFDCLYAPQYFYPDRAHWAFMRGPHLVTSADAAYDAYCPLVEVWICSSNSSTRSRLPSSFLDGLGTVLRRFNREMKRLRAVQEQQLWANRPDYATEARLLALARMDVWSEVVDYGVAFQRGLREKEAWIALAKERKSKQNWGLPVLKDSALTATAADDQFIGLWINGASEDVYLSYLLAQVPCFVVHKFPMANYTPSAIQPCPPTYSNFVDGTDIGDLIHRNAYNIAVQTEP